MDVVNGLYALSHAAQLLCAAHAPDPSLVAKASEVVRSLPASLQVLSQRPDDVAAHTEAAKCARLAAELEGSGHPGLHEVLCQVLHKHFGLPREQVHVAVLPHALRHSGAASFDKLQSLADALGASSGAQAPGALYDLAANLGAAVSLAQLGFKQADVAPAAVAVCGEARGGRWPGLTAQGGLDRGAVEELLGDALEGRRPVAWDVEADPSAQAASDEEGAVRKETQIDAPPTSAAAASAAAVARALPDSVPENAPEHCPGTDSDQAGKASACDGCPNQNACATAPKGPDPDLPRIRERMRHVRNKVLVMSGKGGVGKSTFTAMLGWACARDEAVQAGIMDIDVCGPSIPTILGLTRSSVHASASGWSPVYVSDNLCAMSIGFLLPSAESAVIWRGPKKNGLIKQFLMDVDWTGGLEADDVDLDMDHADAGAPDGAAAGGAARTPMTALDYLLIDTPPGTSDEHLSIVSYLKESGLTGAVLLTTPQEVSLQDVRKEISFCRKVGVPILGVVENMAGFVCPSCGERSDVFYPSTGGARALCDELGLELLGSVPLDPRVGRCCDLGLDFVAEHPESRAAHAYVDIIARIREKCAGGGAVGGAGLDATTTTGAQ